MEESKEQQQPKLAEQQLIGCILNNISSLEKVKHILPVHFSLKEHKKIWELIKLLPAPDILNLWSELSKEGSTIDIDNYEGINYLKYCQSLTPGSLNIKGYANTVYLFYIKRYIKKKASALDELAERITLTTDLKEVFLESESLFTKIDELQKPINENAGPRWAKDIIEKEMIPDIDARKNQTKKFIRTGISDIDTVLYGGLEGERVYLIGASSGIGKTEYANTIVLSALRQGLFVLVFTLEANAMSGVQRIIQMDRGLSVKPFMSPDGMSSDEYLQFMDTLKSANYRLMIDDTPGVSPNRVRFVLKGLKAMGMLPDLLVMDYAGLQEVEPAIARQGDIAKSAYIHSRNKTIAREFKIPFLVLEQFKKEYDFKWPEISAFMYGSYRDADLAIMLYWEARQNKKKKYAMNPNDVSILFGKNRQSGITGKVATVERDPKSGLYKPKFVPEVIR